MTGELNLGRLLEQKLCAIFYIKNEDTGEILGLEIAFEKDILRVYIDKTENTFKLSWA